MILREIHVGGAYLFMIPSDMAKFGFLFLNNGTWNGTQLIPEDWVLNATYDFIHTQWGSYGYQWWIHPEINYYNAIGNYGQIIGCLPDYDVTIVFTARWSDCYPPYFLDLINDYIIPSIEEGYSPLATPTPTETAIMFFFPIFTAILCLTKLKNQRKIK